MSDCNLITNFKNMDKNKWSKFVYNHPKGNIFQTPEMFELFQNTKNYEPVFLAIVNNQNEIAGTLLAVIQKEYSGVLGKFSARSIVFGGPIIKDDNPNVLNLILEEFNKRFGKKAIYLQFRNFWIQTYEKDIFKRHSLVYEDHLNILINLHNKSCNELWHDFKGEVRTNVRRSQKKGVIIKKITELYEIEEAYSILEKVYHRMKKPLSSKTLFENSMLNLHPKNYFQSFLAKVNNKSVGVAFRLTYKGMIYAWYDGADRRYSSYKIQDLLNWHIITWAVENHYQMFDFGGAGKPRVPYGVREYKKKFGGELVNYGRYEKIQKPMIFRIAKAGFEVWQKIG